MDVDEIDDESSLVAAPAPDMSQIDSRGSALVILSVLLYVDRANDKIPAWQQQGCQKH